MDISTVMGAEHALRSAMLSADIDRLDALFAENALLVDCDGTAQGKVEKLRLYPERRLQRSVLDIDVQVVVARDTLAVTVVCTNVAGRLDGRHFEGQMVYTRTWVHLAGSWQVLSAVCRAVGESSR